MTKTNNVLKIGGVVLLALSLAFAFFWYAERAVAQISTEQPTPLNLFRTYTFFATTSAQTVFATTTSATSTNITAYADSSGRIDAGYFVIAGAREVTLFFKRGDTGGQGNSGSTKFRIQVSNAASPAEADWQDYNMLTQNLASSTARTSLSSVLTTAASSTVIVGMDTTLDAFYAIRCIVMETTDGEHSCQASAKW